MLFQADFHTHAIGDGTFGPKTPDLVAAHLEAALKAGLDCIGVTDHDDLRPGLLAVDYAARNNLPLLVIPGMEITTEQGHLVALGIEQSLPSWREMTETINAVREAGAISILPHPFFPQLRDRTDIDAIERFNSRYGDWNIQDNGIAVIASSDAHSPADLLASPYRVQVEAAERSWEAIAKAIRERQVEIVILERTSGTG